MQTIIITNTEAAFYIDKVYNLMDDSVKQEYELLPQNINFNFDPALIIAAPEAIYAVILIIKYGYDTLKKKFENRKLNNLSNITSIEVNEKDSIYKIETTTNKISIKINHKDNFTELSIKEENE